MLVQLSASFDELNDVELAEYSEHFEALLSLHQDRKLLLAVTPKQVSILRRSLDLGARSKAILSTVERRAQDYAAISRLVNVRVTVVPNNSTAVVFDGTRFSDTMVRVVRRLGASPQLFVENSASDGKFYRNLLESYLAARSLPVQLFYIRLFHGGGSSLGAALAALDEGIRGLCVCDRDGLDEVPPFRTGTTACAVAPVLNDAGLVSIEGSVLDHIAPSFRFLITAGWSLENYVGPNLLNVYFDANHGAAEVKTLFQSAFPSFPSLNDLDIHIWNSIYFKNSKQSSDVLRAAVLKVDANVSEEKCRSFSALTFPDGLIEWLTLNWTGTRHSKAIAISFCADLKNSTYAAHVEALASSAFPMFLCDRRIGAS